MTEKSTPIVFNKPINIIGLDKPVHYSLPTALIFISHGVDVIGTDYNKELVATLKSGKTTFGEDGLDELFAVAVEMGIQFTTDYIAFDTYIVAVPIPYDKFSKKID